jgi:hypothetical protein
LIKWLAVVKPAPEKKAFFMPEIIELLFIDLFKEFYWKGKAEMVKFLTIMSPLLTFLG